MHPRTETVEVDVTLTLLSEREKLPVQMNKTPQNRN